MHCISPVLVGYSLGRDKKGDVRFISVNHCRVDEVDSRLLFHGQEVSPIYVGCGNCPLCVKSKKRDVVTRICDETKCHSSSWFITLTYAPEHLPPFGTLVKRDVQLFLKRLRKAVFPNQFRYFLVGEYGKLHLRPHYHLIIFGLPHLPLVFHENRGSYDVYRSPLVERTWPLGFSTVTRFDYANARYVAQYCRKKQDNVTLPRSLLPPFALSSRGRGEGAYGAPFFDKYHSEILRDGFCLVKVRGKVFRVPIPPYYLRRARSLYHDEWLALVLRREDYLKSTLAEVLTHEQVEQRLAEIASAARLVEIKENEAIQKRRYENE